MFPSNFSTIIGKAFEIRGDSDYEDFYIVSESEARLQIKNARKFLKTKETNLEPILEGQDS